jgi:hypothetical protein
MKYSARRSSAAASRTDRSRTTFQTRPVLRDFSPRQTCRGCRDRGKSCVISRPTMCRITSRTYPSERPPSWRRSAVAQHRDPVGDGEHLIQFVRDVNARHAALAQVAQDVQQNGHFRLRQRRRRLVENQNARILGQRLDDFDQLFLTDAQPRRRAAGSRAM